MLDLEPSCLFQEPFSWLHRKGGLLILMWMEAVYLCFGNKTLKPARAALSKGYVCLCAVHKHSCFGRTHAIAAPTNSFSWLENPSREQLCSRQSVYSYFKLIT